LCALLLASLGFGSCEDPNPESVPLYYGPIPPPYEHPDYYGPIPYPYSDEFPDHNTDYAVRVAVRDASSQPVEGAKVTLHYLSGDNLRLMGDTLVTDTDGRIEQLLRWSEEPCNGVILETQKEGFKPDTTEVSVDVYDDSAADGMYMGVFGFDVVITLEAE
ncbi:MAG: hypothetical protein J6Z12_00100, partial [Paludibacteraceae bacterium]|nr:hypothetical protein [Paludibacteraceae bacterium]